ncbi:3-hydroxyacyl-CoA dehydrogenase / enoyl-CoA hydratase / 3-hydroxybutyryl-CoA epimerase [Haloechinothrix alba]|uniref:3-hydroxyacyl-CoA dehydrogenase / enoyl-CoA hydratase / 3-hydroxybutyryl-CoA epimerase n=1 Tax=Haloechinothrix alba TaxID=664784 RepID=A0A238YZQ5_9PSEU|nr:3-hydroxyacyl-CoA dehydrogenase NAD-binding domain-containing protein [Haloechinothrix alba]SNR76198.1 3-hydroxyacyl-CoA dehydrogenase / enoyl-CoA hydratase / 3-hydroxybutyryl-CoA epimerase [Haloechinothrix alba]
MTESKTIRWEQDSDGIVVLTLDDPNQSANTMNTDYIDSMLAIVDRLEQEKDSITGVVVTSAKKTFFAGGDLNDLIQAQPEHAEQMTRMADERVKAPLRKLETLGKPVVAAINGAALGGGLEIALACHHRIAADVKGSQIGLPEVTLGLLPGGGGVTRTVRLLGIQNAVLNVLAEGQRYKPRKAQEVGIVDEVVDSIDELLPKAKEWIKANPEGGVQPWDKDGYKIPGGTPSNPSFAANLPAFPANLRKQLKGAPMPAPRAILAAAVEGSQVDFDTASKIESRYLVHLATGQVSKNMIQAFFFDLETINNGGSRPSGYDKHTVRKVGVPGAGMMGAGIAYVSAKAGMEVVLKDVSVDNAEKGKDYSRKLEEKALSRGKTTQEKSDALLDRITTTGSPEDLDGVDFVIEAVFESTDLKHKVFQEIEDVVNEDAVLGSNTSTLPITGLAQGVKRQEDFIGIHFFSPVDKMPLVEIICGEKTSDATLAKVFDYTLAINKTPIVVNDSRGFFTSRVIGTFINEAIAAVGEGVEPASIEQAGSQAGFPAPPLQLSDELTLTLMQKIRNETRAGVEAAGGTWTPHGADFVVDRMVDEFDRPSKAAGAGFYEYDEDGKRFGLWPGLRDAFKTDSDEVPFVDLQERMLFVQAIETVRCFDEGVLNSVEDANIGSIFGIGFPPWTGGVVQYIKQYPGGLPGFVERARELAARYGSQFEPPQSLVDKANKGGTFE